MSTKDDVLSFLKSNRDREMSGQQIADSLNISRAAVWKAVTALREEGYEIEAATKRGYTLKREIDAVTEDNIRGAICDKYKHIPITVLKTVDSTNTRLKLMAQEGAPHMSVLVALEQTAGKGRQGRSFYSPPNTGLYMSILLRPEGDIEDAQLTTVRSAVAVCRALSRVGGVFAKIKWVNDVYYNNKKVCGILTEASLDFEGGGIEYMITGIGINCTTKDEEFPEDVREIAGSINLTNASRSQLAAAVIEELLDLCDTPHDEVVAEYKERSMMIGKFISYTKSGKTYRAKVLDINGYGNLVVELLSGEIDTLFSGEVSILKDFLKDGNNQ